MKLSFRDRILWNDDGSSTLPALTEAEIDEALLRYRPTPENPECRCVAADVCAACALSQIIDQLRKRA